MLPVLATGLIESCASVVPARDGPNSVLSPEIAIALSRNFYHETCLAALMAIEEKVSSPGGDKSISQ
jgi:hypothetical protein